MSERPLSKKPISPWRRAVAGFARWLHRNNEEAYRGWTLRGTRGWESSDVPFTPLSKPLPECSVALVSSGGFVAADQEPFDLSDPTGDCSFRMIDAGASPESLRVSHAFYDTEAAAEDADVLFPIASLAELAAEGVVGGAAPRHASFSGSIPDPSELVSDYGPELARAFANDGVDLVFLTPA